MLAAIIDAREEPIALTATLGPLVRGVIEGLVGTAILVARHPNEEIESIADAAGCRILIAENWQEGFSRAIHNVPGLGVLVLDTGLQLGPDFWPLLADKLPVIGNRPAATVPAARPGFPSPFRMVDRIVDHALGRVARDSALLVPPSLARQMAQAKTDPYGYSYGKDLVRLPSAVYRVDLR